MRDGAGGVEVKYPLDDCCFEVVLVPASTVRACALPQAPPNTAYSSANGLATADRTATLLTASSTVRAAPAPRPNQRVAEPP